MSEERDEVGKLLDVAEVAFDGLESRAEELGVSVGRLVHMVAMVWIDRLADLGLASREHPRVDVLTNAMAEIGAEAAVRAAPTGPGRIQ